MDEERKARILGHLDKRRTEELTKELEAAGAAEMRDVLLGLVEQRGGREVLDEAKSLISDQAGLRHLTALGDLLARYGIDEIVYDLGVVRGLDYYSGAVFELHYGPLGTASQICGGGSYTLTTVFGGEPLQTTGFGMGFDRVLLALDKAGAPLPEAPLEVYVFPVGDHMAEAAYTVLRQLREAGLSADVDMVGRGPSKNLDYANGVGARFALLVGEREWAEGKVALKDLGDGTQREVAVEEVPPLIRGS